ncbi:MAG: hypothetical protein ACFFCZ_08560 [Promethearchaeota archaeon]
MSKRLTAKPSEEPPKPVFGKVVIKAFSSPFIQILPVDADQC